MPFRRIRLVLLSLDTINMWAKCTNQKQTENPSSYSIRPPFVSSPADLFSDPPIHSSTVSLPRLLLLVLARVAANPWTRPWKKRKLFPHTSSRVLISDCVVHEWSPWSDLHLKELDDEEDDTSPSTEKSRLFLTRSSSCSRTCKQRMGLKRTIRWIQIVMKIQSKRMISYVSFMNGIEFCVLPWI